MNSIEIIDLEIRLKAEIREKSLKISELVYEGLVNQRLIEILEDEIESLKDLIQTICR